MRHLVSAAVVVCVVALLAQWAAASPVLVRGSVLDRDSGEPVIGATVVAGTHAAITDDSGAYTVEAEPGSSTLTIYYGETALQQTFSPLGDTPLVVVPPIRIETQTYTIACYFGEPLTPTTMAAPLLGAEVDRGALMLARTFSTLDLATLQPGAGAAPLRIDGARRLHGAPAVSLALLGMGTLRRRVGDDVHPIAAAELDVDSAAGSNEHGRALKIGGVTGAATGELSTLWWGPWKKDRAWYAVGADLRGDREGVAGQALARGDYAISHAHQVGVAALVTTRGWPGPDAGAQPLGAAHEGALARVVAPNAARVVDTWVDARYRGRMFGEGEWRIDAGATYERLRPAGELVATERRAARLQVTRRRDIKGWHSIRAGGELGAGAGPAGDLGDRAAWLADSWQPTYRLTLAAGIHHEARWHGDARRTITAPHASIRYDRWELRELTVFADASRRADLDDLDGAAWTELVSGAQLEVFETLGAGAAWRTRDVDDTGRADALLAWLTWLPAHCLDGTEARVSAELPTDDAQPAALRVQLTHKRRYRGLEGWQLAAAAHLADSDTRAGLAIGWHGEPASFDLEAYGGDDDAIRISATLAW